jgi:hypothetical protein
MCVMSILVNSLKILDDGCSRESACMILQVPPLVLFRHLSENVAADCLCCISEVTP